MDIVIVPSRSEGFSLVIQESARQHTPVICSNIPVFHELFNDEVEFFSLEDRNMLKRAIIKVGEDASYMVIKFIINF